MDAARKLEIAKKVIDELSAHMDESQSGDLMGLIEKSKPVAKEVEVIGVSKPGKEDFNDQANEAISETGKPEMSMEPMSGDEEMSDQELEDLLRETLK